MHILQRHAFMKLRYLMLFVFFGCTSTSVIEKTFESTDITSDEIQQHIKYLASDELGGRKTGEQGNLIAANYIAGEFRRYGLRPLGEQQTYFQNFPFLSSIRPGKNNRLAVSVAGRRFSFVPGSDFQPLSFTKDTSLTAPLVFVGYGISADSLKYDDYEGVDVQNKIVVALRFSPEGSRTDSVFAKYTSLMVKAFSAREKGAVALILVTGPLDSDQPALIPFKVAQMANEAVAVMTLTWSSLDSIFHAAGRDLRTLQQELNDTRKPRSFPIDRTVGEIQTEVNREYDVSANIIGYIDGTDPELKNDALVIGAHMDHLGLGGEGSGSLKPDTIAVHPGADDNGSGTAGLLELAQFLSSRRQHLKRSILFASFSGEELGLLGSDYYVKHPLRPLDRTAAMINMDMIGRMRDSVLVIEGIGTSPAWEEVVKKANIDSLKLSLKPGGFGPSDHSSFYSRDIPVLFFFTNLHNNYHRPSDTWDKINCTGEQKVVSMIGRIATDIANEDRRPPFTRAASASPMASAGDRQGLRVGLGVVPDYAEEPGGMKISGTRPGSAAEKAGLKGGDIIMNFGGKAVKNVYDYTFLLGNYKAGDEVKIVVKRGNEELTLTATLEARK